MDSLMDKGAILIIGKLLLTFAVLLGIPLWELYALRRDRESGDGRDGGGEEESNPKRSA